MSARDFGQGGNGARMAFARSCPRCERDGPGDHPLCAHCGETLIDQGYCAICERAWRLPVGDFCPKHEVELEPAPDRATDAVAADWITVATYSDPLAPEPPRIRLEAEGIPTSLEGARMGGRSMYLVATGGIQLKVPQDLASDARILLSQSWTAPLPEDDLDDAWDDLSPEPGAKRRTVMKGVIVFIFLTPLLTTLLSWLLAR
jgi:hypothetical protein